MSITATDTPKDPTFPKRMQKTPPKDPSSRPREKICQSKTCCNNSRSMKIHIKSVIEILCNYVVYGKFYPKTITISQCQDPSSIYEVASIISCVAPPPRFPQPPASPLAVPTTREENNELIQNWVDTKVARENPVKKRTKRNDIGELATEEQYTAGAVIKVRLAEARRGPNKSQADPMATRANTAPATAAIPALPISVDVRLRLSRIIGNRGGAANVETKHAKKEIQER
ncbi:hypothetical protein ACJIZ3_005164 [Penstemon smallii]|uniref:Uncharacterized protein n=1 Tax=Penstemon smallii TaxID=265156 RepID=A0ABD3S432_9LAMI